MNKCYALVWNASQGCWNVASEGTRRRGKSAGARAVVASTLALLGAVAMTPAHALPTGGKVVEGSGDIQQVGDKSMSINQHTDKLITNWDSFSVGLGERVTFNQPGSTSISLNRVLGTRGSEILGNIDANGKVFLVNPNGVLFGRTAQVNVGGLVASTQDIKDADFKAGKFQFSGTSTSEVSNLGRLTAAEGGSIALLGAQVSNQGTIQAQMGSVALGGGGDFTLNFDGNKLLDIQVNGAVAEALVRNGGLLKADGGQVIMTARATSSLLGSVVNNQGAIEARTLRGSAGRIVLDGGDGKVTVGGALAANAQNAPGHGGSVEVRGKEVEVNLATQVNTLASNGINGTWKISADKVDVHRTALASGGTIHVDTLSRNLATTNIELNSTQGDLDLNGPVTWAAGNRLTLNSAANLNLNGKLAASGAKAGLSLRARDAIEINDNIVLSGAASSLSLDAGKGHRVNGAASVTLSGANTTYTSGGYYYTVIQTLAQLQAINTNLDGLYVLGNKILGSAYCTALQSIGGPAGVFTGTLDGLGNTIGNLSITNTGSNVGLFARSSGTLTNLKLDNLRVSDNNYGAGPSSLGALVGVNSGRIANVTATRVNVLGSSLRSNAVGGLVGRNNGGRISGASVSGTVSGYAPTTAIGGLVGENASNGLEAIIEDSTTNTLVTAKSTERNSLGGVGGLVGLNSRGRIVNASAQGRVETSRAGLNVGGLVGFNLMGDISRSSASGQVVAGGAGYSGGLVGLNSNDTIAQSQASGAVSSSGGLATGGLVGRSEGDSVLTNVKASGNVTDNYGGDIGGLVGTNTAARVDTAEATGKVTGGANSRVGGLVGSNLNASLSHVISRGDVFGGTNSQVGGIAGSNSGDISSADTSGVVSGGANSSVGGLAGVNFGTLMASSSKSEVKGGARSRIGGLVGENQIQGRISSSSSESSVSGDYYVSMGGIAGVNLGTIEYSGVSGKINFRPQSSYGQIYGSLVGENRGTLAGNYVTGEAAVLPPAGVDYGNIW
ncbi:TPA: filamentous hemagglutinin N-terminal domain-containing protein [Pseudomonas aeruginosa]|nr:filamentous hemagglutinin N-terminal domain-containing protein [Pseudomonas aeruginosa]HEQ0067737.1 filamentous hemagglutinin N-terminal domain-containing protein [Pseudomonas aeruginosa]